ncbi:DNA processing protein [Saccharopolyspora lacisalsi]|uniref:DNA processing protein n=1 Tax=Halosaccharopolyspora lacisalsi TaxID=1000566 RepID=A0A839DVF9_9PSEU|nr:DNA-processing protein DprA [Halosaccharopolyspora lacisalsi]MBA8823265.1 DNA processing protein [Halosaccharopolyspora lacisalsi]
MNTGADDSAEEALLVARAYLSAVAEPPAPALVEFIAEHGALLAADRVHRGRLPSRVFDEVQARREHVRGRRTLEAAREDGVRLVVPEQHEWPRQRFSCFAEATAVGLAEVAEPIALWVRGAASVGVTVDTSVAVVGARAASGYGEALAAEFGYGLASAGHTVVSGAAYGIDGAAHRGAVTAGKPTVALLACGVDVDYPAGHGRLLRSITEQGLVISEYPPGTPPRKHRFLVRNRLIAALGAGVVVVEAGARSGAGNTAGTAEALGRPVMAVPGPVTSSSSVGCHAMVRSGKAILVTRTDDIIEVVSPLGTAASTEVGGPSRTTDRLEQRARQVHDALDGAGAASAEQLARDSGLSLRQVRALLPALEMAGFVTQSEGGWQRCAP